MRIVRFNEPNRPAPAPTQADIWKYNMKSAKAKGHQKAYADAKRHYERIAKGKPAKAKGHSVFVLPKGSTFYLGDIPLSSSNDMYTSVPSEGDGRSLNLNKVYSDLRIRLALANSLPKSFAGNVYIPAGQIRMIERRASTPAEQNA